MPFRLFPILAATLLAVLLLPCRARAGDESACVVAGADAEQRLHLPPGLLLAIGRVESGRPDPSGRITPWPWTINSGGAGRSFDDLSSALAGTRALLATGAGSIDVGCFQINLASHPDAFSTLENAFDPAANADYAARFLTTLRDRTGSWDGAIAAYHSMTPELGSPYRDLVRAAWGGRALPPGDADHPVPAEAPGLRVLAWSPAQGGVRIWTSEDGAGANVIRFPGAVNLPVVSRPGN